MQMARTTKNDVLLFGRSEAATIRAEWVDEKGLFTDFELILAKESVPIRLNAPGPFMVSNAMAAAAVGYLSGLCAATVKAGLEAFVPVSGRMKIEQLANGIHLIDDTYNANPDSMQAALSTLRSMRAAARGIFVAGDMLELGAQAKSLHQKVGALAGRSGIARLCAHGQFAAAVTAGAHEGGMSPADTMRGSRDEIVAYLKNWLQPGDWVLVKGSRGMAMEKVVAGLKAWADQCRENKKTESQIAKNI
jgi:UDP-N-acetylmuramoyl-tripeptide--D-alanyl-D-alanine ligase